MSRPAYDRTERIGPNCMKIWKQIFHFLERRGANTQLSEDVSSDIIADMWQRKPPLLVNYRCRRLPRQLQVEALRRCFCQPKSAIRTSPLDNVGTEEATLARQEAQCDQEDLLEPVKRVLGAKRTDRLLKLCQQGNPRKYELAQAVGMSERQWRAMWAKSRNL